MIVAALGMSACSSTGGARNGSAEKHAIGTGSSGSGGGSTNSNNANSNSGAGAGSNAGNTSNPSVTNQTNSNFGIIGSLLKQNNVDVNGDGDNNYVAPVNTDEINLLQVENRKIVLLPEDKKNVKSWHIAEKQAVYTGSGSSPYRKDVNTFSTIGNQLQYAKFGELYDEFEKRYQFAQGELTPNEKIPTEFKDVVYKGYATYNGSLKEPDVKPKTAKSEFRVNFGERTVIGQIQPEKVGDFDNVTLKAVLKKDEPNQFEGINGDSENRMTVQGGFYGPNAEEMAGLYYSSPQGGIDYEQMDPEKPSGTFGAIKQ